MRSLRTLEEEIRREVFETEEGDDEKDISIKELRDHLKDVNPEITKHLYREARKQSEKSWHLNEESQLA